jgi:hypothetical protein
VFFKKTVLKECFKTLFIAFTKLTIHLKVLKIVIH